MKNKIKFNTKTGSIILRSEDSIEKETISLPVLQANNAFSFAVDSFINETNTKVYALYYKDLNDKSQFVLMTFNSMDDAQKFKMKLDKVMMKNNKKILILKGILYVLSIIVLFKFLFIPQSLLSFSGLGAKPIDQQNKIAQSSQSLDNTTSANMENSLTDLKARVAKQKEMLDEQKKNLLSTTDNKIAQEKASNNGTTIQKTQPNNETKKESQQSSQQLENLLNSSN